MSNEIVIPLHDKRIRAAERFQVVQDVLSAIALVPAGLARIHSHALMQRGLAVVELAAVLGLVVVTVREMRDGDDDITGLSWTNFVIGLILITEAVLRSHEGHKVFSPQMLTGISSIIVGGADNVVRKKRVRRRMIRVTDDRLHIRLGKFRQTDVAWSEIAHVKHSGEKIIVTPRTGRPRTINLKRYENRDDIRAAIMDAVERNAVAKNVTDSLT